MFQSNLKLMPKLSEKGVAQVIILITLLIGLLGGLYLVGQRTNLLPKAHDVPSSTKQVADEQAIPPGERKECGYAPG